MSNKVVFDFSGDEFVNYGQFEERIRLVVNVKILETDIAMRYQVDDDDYTNSN